MAMNLFPTFGSNASESGLGGDGWGGSVDMTFGQPNGAAGRWNAAGDFGGVLTQWQRQLANEALYTQRSDFTMQVQENLAARNNTANISTGTVSAIAAQVPTWVWWAVGAVILFLVTRKHGHR